MMSHLLYESCRLQPVHVSTASAVASAPATTGKGRCNKFLAVDGCPLGRTCPCEHPRDSPNRCYICGSN
eukprot:387729-Prorocentrum_lima.AAC.1